LPHGAPGYPAPFLHLSHPPAGVYVRGSADVLEALLGAPRVTIVGTRRATGYGTRVVREFSAAFTARGLAVVSGMALGIDGRAHETALEGGGLTAAVLGCGVDVVYPQRHRGLYDLIVQRGVVMSELPPGAHAAPWSFPNRNRLLAALGDGVLVVEGAVTSGAMQTAEQAIALGRAVFAVPGHIYLDGHRGCNLLLRDGATPAIDPPATVEEFLLQTRIERGERRPAEAMSGPGQGKQDPFMELAAAGREDLLEAMDERPCSIDALVRRTGKAPRLLSAAIAELELAGLVRRAGPGLYIRAP
jgi:DNA processing protein